MPRMQASPLHGKIEDSIEHALRLQITTFTQPRTFALHRLRVLQHSKHRMQRVYRAVWLLLILFIAL